MEFYFIFVSLSLTLIFISAPGMLSNKMGRSVSHGGLPRGGGRMGRRTSMAF